MAAAIIPLGLAVQPAAAVDATDSALTVAWLDDTSSAADLQPDRATTSLSAPDPNPHLPEFQNLTVTVSQTQELTDQAIRISVAGMPGGTEGDQDAASHTPAVAKNFVQAMQCWGDPAAENFRETCQWGGYIAGAPNGDTNLQRLPAGNYLRMSPQDTYNADRADTNPFLSVQGNSFSGKRNGNEVELLQMFGPATTNEVNGANIGVAPDGSGAGFFDFEVQSALLAPQLGCGSEGHERCYLVIVPRGTIYGGQDTNSCGQYGDKDSPNGLSYGRSDTVQSGSPISRTCDYWDNRIVVPLDFQPVNVSCPEGAAERRAIGSQLLVQAMSSWQPSLCADLETIFAFSANPDAVAREQLLLGQAGMAFTSRPLTADELTTEGDQETLAETDLAYAPVAVTAAVVAFNIEGFYGRLPELKLTPLLMAKLLTQSYGCLVPSNQTGQSHLPAGTLRCLDRDPDFLALNPEMGRGSFPPLGLIIPGPAGADAYAAIWQWIQADDAASAFLRGDTHQINPYFLPKGHPDAQVPTLEYTLTATGVVASFAKDPAGNQLYTSVGLAEDDGSPLSLATSSIDSFLYSKSDLTGGTVPDATLEYTTLHRWPYGENMYRDAVSAFRADTGSMNTWDPFKPRADGDSGDWKADGPWLPGQRFILSITDAASAARYGLDTAQLQVPNEEDTFVGLSDDSMGVAIATATPSSIPDVLQMDAGAMPADAYPLTAITYASVNLTTTDAAARADYADFIDLVTTSGQDPGPLRGQLPAGYLPLPAGLQDAAAMAAERIRNYVPGTTSSTTPPKAGANTHEDADTVPGQTDTAIQNDAIGDTAVTASAVTGIPGTAVGLSLGIGALGLAAAPFLMRRKGSP